MDSFKKTFRDITRGFSSGNIFSKDIYIKHLSWLDQTDQETKYDEFYTYALNHEILTVEQKLKILKENNLWGEKDEREISEIRMMIDGLIDSKKKNLKLPSLVKKQLEQIAEEEKKLQQKLLKKHQLLGLTCESYADIELNDFYLLNNLFRDPALENKAFSVEEIDGMDNEEVSTLISECNKLLSLCSDTNIKKLAMQPFFQAYFSVCGEDFTTFFKKPVYELTFFQVSLLRFASQFKYIYANHDVSTWDKNILNDPDLFLEYAAAVEKGKNEVKEKGMADDEVINIGVNPEDSKALGIKAKNTLAEEVAKSGGNLMDFFMKRK